MKNYHLHLKGYVGGWDFDSDYVDYVLEKHQNEEVDVLIDSLGGSLATALSIAAAFKRHGNVNVHFVGMNASASTIASMGAKHITMDSSAMYLVHKCSVEFFEWASANSDDLADIIKEARQMKNDLEKMDANVANMYAEKCNKSKDELLALMSKGGWLTSDEALEWGFVDEITDFDEDAAPVMTDSIAADMYTHGIPVPTGFAARQESFLSKMTSFFKKIFNSNNNMEEDIKKPTEEQPVALEPAAEPEEIEAPVEEAPADEPAPEAEAEVEVEETPAEEETEEQPEEAEETPAEEPAEASLKAELTALREEVTALKARLAETRQVMGTPTAHNSNEFVKSWKSAQDLYNSLK